VYTLNIFFKFFKNYFSNFKVLPKPKKGYYEKRYAFGLVLLAMTMYPFSPELTLKTGA